MTDPQPTLADFLLARYDEAEEKARNWWQVKDAMVAPGFTFRGDVIVETDDGRLMTRDEYFDRYMDRAEPDAFALAECDAKRQIVVECGRSMIVFGGTRREAPVLRLLALPYADHPDYRQEWTP